MSEVAALQQVEDFDEFFDAHYAEVVRTLTLAIGEAGRAEDGAQEAFAQAYRKWSTVSRMERPVGWVVVVGINRLKRWIIRGERTWSTDQEPAADSHDPTATIAGGTDLRDALDRLPPRQRATVVLRYLCDLSTDDVARALGCSTGTVKSALHQALANLRVDLEPLDEERDDHAR